MCLLKYQCFQCTSCPFFFIFVLFSGGGGWESANNSYKLGIQPLREILDPPPQGITYCRGMCITKLIRQAAIPFTSSQNSKQRRIQDFLLEPKSANPIVCQTFDNTPQFNGNRVGSRISSRPTYIFENFMIFLKIGLLQVPPKSVSAKYHFELISDCISFHFRF